MDMVGIGNSIKPMQIHQDASGIHRRRLDELHAAFDGNGLTVTKPSPGDGLMAIIALNGRAGHAIATMLGGVTIVNGNGSADDGVATAQWQIGIGKEFDRLLEVAFPSRYLQALMFVDEVAHLAAMRRVLVGTFSISSLLQIDVVGVEVAPG